MIPKGFLLTAIGVGVLSESNLSTEWKILIMVATSLAAMLLLVAYQRWREDRILRHIDTQIAHSTSKILEALETTQTPPKPAPRKRAAPKPPVVKK